MEAADERSGASGRGRVGHSCRNWARHRCRAARVPQRAHRAEKDAESIAGGVASQHRRLDRYGRLANCHARLGSQATRQWVIAVAVVVYGYAAVGNAVITRGRHLGGYLMAGAIVLALMGL